MVFIFFLYKSTQLNSGFTDTHVSQVVQRNLHTAKLVRVDYDFKNAYVCVCT